MNNTKFLAFLATLAIVALVSIVGIGAIFMSETWATPDDFDTGAVLTETQLDKISSNLNFLYHKPCARVYDSSNQSIPSSTETKLTFDSERYDNDGIHSTSLNTERLTAQTPGVYDIKGQVRWASGNNSRSLYIKVNGSDIIASQETMNLSTDTIEQQVGTQYFLTAGDYVELFVFHDHGSNINVEANPNQSPEFMMCWQSSGSNS